MSRPINCKKGIFITVYPHSVWKWTQKVLKAILKFLRKNSSNWRSQHKIKSLPDYLKKQISWVKIFGHSDETTVGGENRHPRSSSIGAAIYFAAPFKTLIFWPPFISCYEAKTCTTLRSLELVVALKVFKLISQKGDLLRSSSLHCCEFLTVVMTAFWRS